MQKTISWEIVEVVWWLGREGRDEVVVVVEGGEGHEKKKIGLMKMIITGQRALS